MRFVGEIAVRENANPWHAKIVRQIDEAARLVELLLARFAGSRTCSCAEAPRSVTTRPRSARELRVSPIRSAANSGPLRQIHFALDAAELDPLIAEGGGLFQHFGPRPLRAAERGEAESMSHGGYPNLEIARNAASAAVTPRYCASSKIEIPLRSECA